MKKKKDDEEEEQQQQHEQEELMKGEERKRLCEYVRRYVDGTYINLPHGMNFAWMTYELERQ